MHAVSLKGSRECNLKNHVVYISQATLLIIGTFGSSLEFLPFWDFGFRYRQLLSFLSLLKALSFRTILVFALWTLRQSAAFYISRYFFSSFLIIEVSLGGLATIFVTRSQRFSFMERPGTLLLFAFIFAQAAASILGAYGLGGFPFNGVTDWG